MFMMILSYRLLAKEGSLKKVRPAMLLSSLAFMMISTVIFGGAVYLEVLNGRITPQPQQQPKNVSRVPAMNQVTVIDNSQKTEAEIAKDKQAAKENAEKIVIDKEVKVYDLRPFVELTEEERATKESEVNMTKYLLVHKNKDVNTMFLTFSTSGKQVNARCLTQTCKYFTDVRKEEAEAVSTGRNLNTAIHVAVDVTDYKVGVTFLVIVESTYINAFQGESQWWAGALAEYETKELNLLVIFRQYQPFTAYELKSGPPKAPRLPLIAGQENIIIGKTETNEGELQAATIFWRIPNPTKNIIYDLDWKWDTTQEINEAEEENYHEDAEELDLQSELQREALKPAR